MPSVLPIAAAIEFLHAASIILDDLPSMDNAFLRRGNKTTHLRFGEARTILTACWLCDVAQYWIHQFQQKNPVSGACDLEESFRLTKNQLMLGQIRDLANKSTSQKEIVTTYEQKSGALYAFVCSAPAQILGLTTLSNQFRRFGTLLGTAYQISDDLSDQTATEAALHKDVHKDDGKHTLPRRFGLKRARDMREKYYARCLAELDKMPRVPRDLKDLARRVIFFESDSPAV